MHSHHDHWANRHHAKHGGGGNKVSPHLVRGMYARSHLSGPYLIAVSIAAYRAPRFDPGIFWSDLGIIFHHSAYDRIGPGSGVAGSGGKSPKLARFGARPAIEKSVAL